MAQKSKIPKEHLGFIKKNGRMIPIDKRKSKGGGLKADKKNALKGASRDIKKGKRDEAIGRNVKKTGIAATALGGLFSFSGNSSIGNRSLGGGFRNAAKKGITKARFGKKAMIAGGLAALAGYASEKIARSDQKFARKDKKALKRKGKFSMDQVRAIERRGN